MIAVTLGTAFQNSVRVGGLLSLFIIKDVTALLEYFYLEVMKLAANPS